MQISKTSNRNFGIMVRNNIKIFDNVKITRGNFRKLTQIADELNAGDALGIAVFGEVGQPTVMGGVKSMRITTAPTQLDMSVIKSFRPDAEVHAYKRRSKWIALDDIDIIKKLSIFIRKQKGFIHHCKIDPHHNATPFDKPAWRPNPTRTVADFHHEKTNLGDFIRRS